MSRQRPFEFTPSAASVRRMPLCAGGYRLGCYTRCYTIWATSVPAARTTGTNGSA